MRIENQNVTSAGVFEKGVLKVKSEVKIHEKHLWSWFLVRLQAQLYYKWTFSKVFSQDFDGKFQSTYFPKHLSVDTPEIWLYLCLFCLESISNNAESSKMRFNTKETQVLIFDVVQLHWNSNLKLFLNMALLNNTCW